MYKLGMIGLSPGNGHPYSWSAIFNGYDREKMAQCPFPTIPEYLSKVEESAIGVEGARVTHIWTQERDVSEHVAAASRIEHVVDDMTDLIGAVDAVLLARDDGENHLKMATPFIEEGIPILVDKPLTDNLEDLGRFIRYYEAGRPIMSCSSLRYVDVVRQTRGALGKVLTAHGVTGKDWRTYGIHLIEGIFAVMGHGVESIQTLGREGEEIVHLQYADGAHAVLQSFRNIEFALHLGFYGDKGSKVITDSDPYSSFRDMLVAFVETLKTGQPAFDWRETVEMSKIVVAALVSLREGSRVVPLAEIM